MTTRDYEEQAKPLAGVCLVLFVAVFLLLLFAALQSSVIQQLKNEAFERGYAVFEPNENTGNVVFKWKETQKP